MLTGLICAAAVSTMTVYLAPDGDDAAPGTATQPVKTLQGAVDRIRAVERDAPKEIIVRDGFYSFEKAVCLNANDCDLAIRAEHPGKVVFSGGVRLGKWRKDETDGRFLVADLPFEPKPGAHLTLMSSGAWRDIAVFPESGRLGIDGGRSTQKAITFAPKSVPEGVDITSVDIASVWLEVPQEYAVSACAIKEIDAEHGTFWLQNEVSMSFSQFNHGFSIRNTRLGLTRPGRWIYEAPKRRVVYYPAEGETAENLNATVSRAGAILFLGNTLNVTVDGIVFEGCLMEGGTVNMYAQEPHKAAISGNRAVGTLIDRCEVWNCAAAGLSFTRPHGVTIRRTHVHHVGGRGIYLYEQGSDNAIEWSEVDNCGMMVPSALVYSYSSKLCFVGNKIHDGPGCGATMWTTGSLIASNTFYRVMKSSRDGGCVYGGFMNCTFHDNLVFDTGGWPGLYADEGSRNCLYYNNRFVNSSWPIHMHCTQGIVVSNNEFRADARMWFSFQGSGHGVFCDNRIYALKPLDHDGGGGRVCDFWGRNTVYVKQEDGSYRQQDVITLTRPKDKPGTFAAPNVSEQPKPPYDEKGEVVFEFFGCKAAATATGADGCPNPGVPQTLVRACYDVNYLYLGFTRVWNKLRGYRGQRNFTSRGWGHCDATRVDFEGGKWVIYYPDGSFETSPHFSSGKAKIQKDDVKGLGGADCIMRLPLAALGVKGAREGLQKLDLEMDATVADAMLTDEAAEAERGPERKLPPAVDAVGCSIKFNVTAWNEDYRESKSLYPPDGANWATGTLSFLPPAEGKGKKGRGKGKAAKRAK